MMNNVAYLGMDVHKDTYTVCLYDAHNDKYYPTVKMKADFREVLKYLGTMRPKLDPGCEIICGYEAGCLGYTLHRQLTGNAVECVILAPSTMPVAPGARKKKTDSRDAKTIAECLAYGTYASVYVLTPEDEAVRDYIRMAEDHRSMLKKVKQQIQALCLRHNFCFTDGKTPWTQKYMKWLRGLKPGGILQETLEEYIAAYDQLTEKLDRFEQKIEEIAAEERYTEKVKMLTCFHGIKTKTALSLVVEIGDFNRFAKASQLASYLGLDPGEHTSAETRKNLSITKAGNGTLRKLLVESANCYTRGAVSGKSKELQKRQKGQPPKVIAYADRSRERLKRRYLRLVVGCKMNSNKAKTAIARELACFIWGMMTDHMEPKEKQNS